MEIETSGQKVAQRGRAFYLGHWSLVYHWDIKVEKINTSLEEVLGQEDVRWSHEQARETEAAEMMEISKQ